MQETLILESGLDQASDAQKQIRGRRQRGLGEFVSALVLLIGAAWGIGYWGNYTPGSEIGYNLGLTGGIMMLVLFLYPLRKHLRVMHNLGPAKYWFALHMAMGILGPLFILAHSRFQVGSINAGVALACMTLVAGSGVIGRFIYIKIHHGLYGHRASLQEVRAISGLNSQEVQSKLAFAPSVEAALTEFEAQVLNAKGGVLSRGWAFVSLPVRARMLYLRCAYELARLYARQAEMRNWEPAKKQRRLKAAKRIVQAHLRGVQNVAHFSTYERMFSLWHVLHVPLVYMLVLSAIAHVVAVHMY
jgi:hypothetical protein